MRFFALRLPFLVLPALSCLAENESAQEPSSRLLLEAENENTKSPLRVTESALEARPVEELPAPDMLAHEYEAILASEGVSGWANLSSQGMLLLNHVLRFNARRVHTEPDPAAVQVANQKYAEYEAALAAAGPLSDEDRAALKESIIPEDEP